MKTGLLKYEDTMTEAQSNFERYIDDKLAIALKYRAERYSSEFIGYNLIISTVHVSAMPYIQNRFNAYGFTLKASQIGPSQFTVFTEV